MVRVNSGTGIQHKEGVGASVVGIETMWASYFYRNGEKEGVPRGGTDRYEVSMQLRRCFDPYLP